MFASGLKMHKYGASMLRGGIPSVSRGILTTRGFSSTGGLFHNADTTINKDSQIPDLSALKLNSAGSNHLYAVFKLHNMPYLVTKGDAVYLPFKLKNAQVGDELVLNDVTTLGSPDFTYNNDKGISTDVFRLKASVVEITKEPYYEVYRKKQRCRRLKTFPVEPFQTVLRINELRLL